MTDEPTKSPLDEEPEGGQEGPTASAEEPAGEASPREPEEPSVPTEGRFRRYPRYAYNPISLVGAALAVSMAFAIIFLFIIDVTSDQTSPYIGIVGFAILPVPLILGLIAIPIGMWLEWRREQRAGEEAHVLPRVDFNKPEHRRALVTFVIGTVIFLFMTAGGSYKAYEYTESVQFCGTVCHSVMEPEYTTYQHGPHARVKCVECHIGSGAEWYVRSKISGSYQVYSVLFHKYPQPIATPIQDLRPARETCEECHWPAKFHGDQMWDVARYLGDEQNTRWHIRMVMKTGGAEATGKGPHGIHWHISQRVEYVAADSTRQEIREVRQYLPDGTVEVFQNTWNPISEEERAALPAEEIRVMDCMDCHNRPAHNYLSPRRSMDEALEGGQVPADLPYIKREGTTLLAADYADREEGMSAIDAGIRSYYGENYPEMVTSHASEIDKAVAGIQEMFQTYFFPYMKARWDSYPTNIGHQEYPGCFRCHNGAFETEEGKTIPNDCQLCHTILSQGPGEPGTPSQGQSGLEFQHPEDIGGAWREMACSDCHTGGEYY